MAKILLVEDDKSLREIYGVRLLAEGYDIVSAGDGEEALAMAIKDRPDLIISDVMMPKISGFDMLDILRSTTETKAIKVIMMTALSSEDQRARGEALGADRYLVKSQVGIEDVVRTVHEVLGDNVTAAAPAKNPFEAAAAAPTPPTTDVPLPATAVRPAPAAVPPMRLEPTPLAVAPTPLPTPSTAPEPIPTPQPAMSIPEPAPTPIVPPVPPQPTPVPPVDPVPMPVPLPTPSTAPYTAAQPTLAERVITPLSPTEQPVDMGDLMNQELSGVNGQSQPPLPPVPPVDPVQPVAPVSSTPPPTI